MLYKDPIFLLCLLHIAIRVYNGQRRNQKLTRAAPWFRLLNFGDDYSFLNLTGFTRFAFMQLEAVLLDGLPVRRGRPPQLDFRGQLGLYLFFLGSRMGLKHLCMLFGIVPSSASVFINRMMKLVSCKLSVHPRAAVIFPSQEEMLTLSNMVRNRESMAGNVIGFLDGLALPVQCSSAPTQQATYYNGYHHDTTINNTFLFLADGRIGFACINYPGSWHDAQVCADLIATVLEK